MLKEDCTATLVTVVTFSHACSSRVSQQSKHTSSLGQDRARAEDSHQ